MMEDTVEEKWHWYIHLWTPHGESPGDVVYEYWTKPGLERMHRICKKSLADARRVWAEYGRPDVVWNIAGVQVANVAGLDVAGEFNNKLNHFCGPDCRR